MNRFSQIFLHPQKGAEAGVRSNFVATNPTTGTGIVSLAGATSRSATANLMTVFNNADEDNGEDYVIHPIRLKLTATEANSSATNLRLVVYTDIIDRYTSGGTTLTAVETIASGEANWSPPTTKAVINFGLLVTKAASDENLIAHPMLRQSVLAAMDVVDIWFGDSPGMAAGDGTNVKSNSNVVPLVTLRAGACMIIDVFGASQAADPVYEVEFWFVENPHAA